MKAIAIVLILALSASYFYLSSSPQSLEIEKMYQQFLAEYGKSVSSGAEYEIRLKIFEQNLRIIAEHNSRASLYTLGINKFADMTLQEIKGGSWNIPASKDVPELQLTGVYADSIDWRSNGVIGPVLDQGTCSSCWAFASTTVVEANYAIANSGKLNKFSEQQLVDCSDIKGNDGCNAGTSEFSYEYLKEYKFWLGSDYAYTGTKGRCQASNCNSKALSTVARYDKIQMFSIAAMKEAVNKGPVSAVVESNNNAFIRYSGGIIDETADWGVSIDRGVAVVGYGATNGTDYFIIKNSMGAKWGEEGYARIKATKEKEGGVCGLLMQVLLPSSK